MSEMGNEMKGEESRRHRTNGGTGRPQYGKAGTNTRQGSPRNSQPSTRINNRQEKTGVQKFPSQPSLWHVSPVGYEAVYFSAVSILESSRAVVAGVPVLARVFLRLAAFDPAVSRSWRPSDSLMSSRCHVSSNSSVPFLLQDFISPCFPPQ